MEKEMLVHLKLKEGKLETFMGWMQSDEGMSVRKSVAYPEKTIGAMIPDKSGMLFKVNVHNEAGMKEKSISTVKVLKTYALEIGIPEKDWDAGVNKAVDKHYGSKYDKAKTDKCHTFVEALVPNGAERVKKVVQTLY